MGGEEGSTTSKHVEVDPDEVDEVGKQTRGLAEQLRTDKSFNRAEVTPDMLGHVEVPNVAELVQVHGTAHQVMVRELQSAIEDLDNFGIGLQKSVATLVDMDAQLEVLIRNAAGVLGLDLPEGWDPSTGLDDGALDGIGDVPTGSEEV